MCLCMLYLNFIFVIINDFNIGNPKVIYSLKFHILIIEIEEFHWKDIKAKDAERMFQFK
mgnify:FL=1